MNFTLTRAHTISSALIRARLWDNWSHGFMNEGGTRIIDSTFKFGGVRTRELKDALHGVSEALVVTAPLDREQEAREWTEEQIGKGYDWRAIYGFALGDRTWNDDFSWFCFELIAARIEIGSSYRFRNRNRVTGTDLIVAAATLRGEQ